MTSMLVAALIAGKVTLSGGQLAIIVDGDDRRRRCPSARDRPLHRRVHVGIVGAGVSRTSFFCRCCGSPGLFIPLPKFLEPWAVIWPAFHVNQVALGSAGVSEFSFIAPAISAAVLVGVTVIFGGLAIRRLARKG